MSLTVFNELLSLGQCLPGPTSTQVSFAIGVTQKGIPGGLLSGMLFQYPGLMMMSLAGAGAAEILVDPAKWLRGVSAGLSAAGRGGSSAHHLSRLPTHILFLIKADYVKQGSLVNVQS